jgi:hypothetical protein
MRPPASKTKSETADYARIFGRVHRFATENSPAQFFSGMLKNNVFLFFVIFGGDECG